MRKTRHPSGRDPERGGNPRPFRAQDEIEKAGERDEQAGEEQDREQVRHGFFSLRCQLPR